MKKIILLLCLLTTISLPAFTAEKTKSTKIIRKMFGIELGMDVNNLVANKRTEEVTRVETRKGVRIFALSEETTSYYNIIVRSLNDKIYTISCDTYLPFTSVLIKLTNQYGMPRVIGPGLSPVKDKKLITDGFITLPNLTDLCIWEDRNTELRVSYNIAHEQVDRKDGYTDVFRIKTTIILTSK